MNITQDAINRAEMAVSNAERKLADYQGNRFLSKDFYDLRSYATQARQELESLKAQRESEFVTANATREVTETASADYLSKSQTELDAAQKLLRESAIKAQDALVAFLDARQALEDDFVRISAALTVRGLTLDGDYRNGASRDVVRIAGKDYIRSKDSQTHLSLITGRVANARIYKGGLLGGLTRLASKYSVLADVPLPKAAKFPDRARLVAPPREDTTPSNMTDQERKAAIERRKPTPGRPFSPIGRSWSQP